MWNKIRTTAMVATLLAGTAAIAYAQSSSTLGTGGSTAGSGSSSTTLGTGGSSAGGGTGAGSASTLGTGGSTARGGRTSTTPGHRRERRRQLAWHDGAQQAPLQTWPPHGLDHGQPERSGPAVILPYGTKKPGAPAAPGFF